MADVVWRSFFPRLLARESEIIGRNKARTSEQQEEKDKKGDEQFLIANNISKSAFSSAHLSFS